MIFIISSSLDYIKTEGSFFWGEKYFPEIRNYIPLNTTDVISITEGIIYFNKTNQKQNPALKIKVYQTHITKVYLKIHFTVIEQLKYNSFQVKNAHKQYFQKNSVLELPFCSAVDEKRFYSMLENGKLFSEILFYQTNNNWQEIYKILERFMPIENSELWNNSKILSSFAFATAKLSECTENLKKKFQDKYNRKEYLNKKKFIRELTIKLRNRCIELEPNNSAYYSNLAYTFYQSVNELNTPNGRRDGNLIREAEQALFYLEKTLTLDSSRITDRYRKAILLSEILPNHTLYKNLNENPTDKSDINIKYASAIEMIKRGIEEFVNLVQIFEKLSSNKNSSDHSNPLKHQYNKYYIKALYHIAQKRVKLAKIDFNLMNLLYGYKVIQVEPNETGQIIQSLNIANSYINKCIQADYSKKKEEKYLIDLVECDNFIPAVYKAYVKGVIETYLYVITNLVKHLNTAKEFFHKALELNFPKEQSKQNKIFVLEKIAALNLIEGKCESSIKLLEPIYKNSNTKAIKTLPPYAAFTLTIAYVLIGDKQKALQIIENYSSCGNKIFEYKFKKLNELVQQKWEAKSTKY
jgi:DNA-directed RNA polymerase subunit F